MFVLTILEKIKETRLRFFQGSVIKDGKLSISKIKLTNTQLHKLKSAAKNKTGTILSINKKNLEDEELPHNYYNYF